MDNQLDLLRKYRFELQNFIPSFNSDGKGIALFDLTGTYLALFLIDKFVLKLKKKSAIIYYLSVLPISYIVHASIGQKTFLNTKLLSGSLNEYTILMIIIICLIVVVLQL